MRFNDFDIYIDIKQKSKHELLIIIVETVNNVQSISIGCRFNIMFKHIDLC